VYYTLYKDEKLKENLFSLEDFEELEPRELSLLVQENNNCVSSFTPEELKKVAACPFFLNSLLICKNNPFTFFGKPIVELTNYQQDLFQNGLRFKNVIESEGKGPPILESLKEVVDWYEKKVTGEKEKNEDAAGSTMFGASKEELESHLGDVKGGVDLHSALEKENKVKKNTGGRKHLDLHDMLKIHGEI
jgi:hypothetical protein